MILVFGGTTEGRKAAEVLEEAGEPYFYSTKTGEQALTLHHGSHIDGAMDPEAMRRFCNEHGIQLIIDAAHPFAASLHTTIAEVAKSMSIPVIRYERIYPPRDEDILWIDDYSQIPTDIRTLLATTGVQSISKLKPLEARGIKVFYRILQRESSIRQAKAQGATEDQLCYYEDGSTIAIDADAILLKESGESGGFREKVKAARDKGMSVIALKRPEFPMGKGVYKEVDGPHGLRRTVEQILPDFFPLHTGLTTGTCATAAVVAATLQLLSGEQPPTVPIRLANGETISVDVGYSDGCAYCIKDFSDDPDVTRGCKIFAKVSLQTRLGESANSPRRICELAKENESVRTSEESEKNKIRFLQGDGVGRVTLPGLGIPVGEPAINPVPRQMMTEAVRALTDQPLDITISVEHGRELAERTFNPRVGVVGGISIIGTSGIVKPLSNDAFIESIGRELEVARAIGCEAVGLASGKKGEEALLAEEPDLRVIHYGNFIGAALAKAHALGFQRLVLGIMLGKAVKLAEGHLDTHSHKVLMNKAFLAEVASEAGVNDATAILDGITLARELWTLMPPTFFDKLRQLCYESCRSVFPDGDLAIKIIRNE